MGAGGSTGNGIVGNWRDNLPVLLGTLGNIECTGRKIKLDPEGDVIFWSSKGSNDLSEGNNVFQFIARAPTLDTIRSIEVSGRYLEISDGLNYKITGPYIVNPIREYGQSSHTKIEYAARDATLRCAGL